MGDKAGVLVIGSDERLGVLARAALTHPVLAVTWAAEERAALDGLTAGGCQLVLLAGNLGRRSALTMVEVVRLRQATTPLLVITGASGLPRAPTQPPPALDDLDAAVGPAADRTLPSGVTIINAPERCEGQAALDLGWELRGRVLAALDLAEDPESAMTWVADYQREALGGRGIHPGSPPGPGRGASPDGPPPLGEVELARARRLCQLVRGRSRAEPPPLVPGSASGLAWTVETLTHRGAELEAQLALLAAVVEQQAQQLAAGAAQVEDLKARLQREAASERQQRDAQDEQRSAGRQQAQLLRRQLTQVEERLAALTTERDTLAAELAALRPAHEALRAEVEQLRGEFDDTTQPPGSGAA